MALLLPGPQAAFEIDDLGQKIASLERENAQLRRDVATASLAARQAQESAGLAMGNLRRQLSPLYRALQMVFGELDAAGVSEQDPAGAPRASAVWENWKQRVGASAAKCIDALIVHRELNTQQMSVATGLHRTTIPKLIYVLNKNGLINKNSGRYSLKELP